MLTAKQTVVLLILWAAFFAAIIAGTFGVYALWG
jgi:hypothetical protein